MKQDIPFNTAQAGTVHNMCLDNVRRGFGIDNKYASAWEAWEHTQQHADRNLPDGLDVPLFYSYTATIDGVTQNYGHINVRLANGTVWSDGNVYPSIDAYLANHLPKYVGWGESVNDIKIIEGDNMVIEDEHAARAILYLNGWTDKDIQNANPIPDLVGRNIVDFVDSVQHSPDSNPYKHNVAKVVAYDADVAAAGGDANKKLAEIKQIVS